MIFSGAAPGPKRPLVIGVDVKHVDQPVARHAYHSWTQWRSGGVAQRLDRVGQQIVMEPNRVGEPVNMKTIRGSIQRRGDNLGRIIGWCHWQGFGGDVGDGIDHRRLAVHRVENNEIGSGHNQRAIINAERNSKRRISERDLPYHPLHDQGYESIGCAPCTQPGSGREGRWAGTDKTECGIHVELVDPS